MKNELTYYTKQLCDIGKELGISYITLGFHPEWKLDEIPKMPNPNNRYNIISNHFDKISKYGTDMMRRTCSSQASIDYSSESDMIKKFKVSLSLQPILTALFSNSPFVDGSPSGLLSSRSYAWANASPGRTGILPLIFEDNFSFEKFVDYTLDLPLFVVFRDGKYLNANGEPFHQFMNGNLNILPNQLPHISDWFNHICTLWSEVRLKNILEIRGSDSGSTSSVCALTAIIVGLMYEQSSLDSAWEIVKNWDMTIRNKLYHDAIYEGLDSKIDNKITAKDIAKEILDIAYSGLKIRNENNSQEQDESHYLDFAYELIQSGQTHAQQLLHKYHNQWHSKVCIEDITPF